MDFYFKHEKNLVVQVFGGPFEILLLKEYKELASSTCEELDEPLTAAKYL